MRGWNCVSAPYLEMKADGGRRYPVLKRMDATKIYCDIHQGPVAVIFEEMCYVRVRPDILVIKPRNMQKISRFCRYKSFTYDLGNRRSDWLPEFDAWMKSLKQPQSTLDGRSDARILPLHIFANQGEYDLSSASGRKELKSCHSIRGSSDLRDGVGRRWQLGAHGTDVLHVLGQALEPGLHWDVQSSGNRTEIASTSTVWELRREGYANVYPNAHIRKGQKMKCGWPEDQSVSADKKDGA